MTVSSLRKLGSKTISLALVPLAALFSCSEPNDGKTNPGGPSAWELASEPQTTIGQAEGEAPYLFSRVGPAVLLPDGRIAVSDQDDAAVRIFLPDGSFEVEFGGRGEGPGEFASISRILVIPPDTLLVHDSRLLRLTKYLTSGELVSTLPLQAEGGFPEVLLGQFSTGELGFSWIRAKRIDPTQILPDEMEFGRFDASGELVVVIGSEPGMRRKGSPVAFSPHLYAGMVGDSIVLTNGSRPEIEVWDSEGTLLHTVHVPVPAVDEASAWDALESELTSRNNEMELGFLGRDPREPGVPVIGRMLVDDQNRIWAKAFDPRTDNHLLMGERGFGGEWFVVDLQGNLVATVNIPKGFLLLDIRDDKVLGKTVDSLGVERVEVYEGVGSN